MKKQDKLWLNHSKPLVEQFSLLIGMMSKTKIIKEKISQKPQRDKNIENGEKIEEKEVICDINII